MRKISGQMAHKLITYSAVPCSAAKLSSLLFSSLLYSTLHGWIERKKERKTVFLSVPLPFPAPSCWCESFEPTMAARSTVTHKLDPGSMTRTTTPLTTSSPSFIGGVSGVFPQRFFSVDHFVPRSSPQILIVQCFLLTTP
ncbi:hypothetical protein V2J09_022749 [Rumex salicifolius]